MFDSGNATNTYGMHSKRNTRRRKIRGQGVFWGLFMTYTKRRCTSDEKECGLGPRRQGRCESAESIFDLSERAACKFGGRSVLVGTGHCIWRNEQYSGIISLPQDGIYQSRREHDHFWISSRPNLSRNSTLRAVTSLLQSASDGFVDLFYYMPAGSAANYR